MTNEQIIEELRESGYPSNLTDLEIDAAIAYVLMLRRAPAVSSRHSVSYRTPDLREL